MAQGLYAQDHLSPHAPIDGMARLADKLVKRLGIKDAQRMCRENSWYGVLRVIQGHVDNGAHS